MNVKNIFTRSIATLFALLCAIYLSSCTEEGGMNPPELNYSVVTNVTVLDIETGQVHFLAKGTYPQIVPDSDIIYYTTSGGLYSINIDSTGAKQIIGGVPYVQDYSFPRNGQKAVVRLVEGPSNGPWANNMYIMNIDGSQRTKILTYDPPYDPTPAFSPLMDKIVFTNGRVLASIDIHGGSYKVIKPKIDSIYYYNVKFLPDNDRIVFAEILQDKNYSIVSKTIKVLSLSSNTEVTIGKYEMNFGFDVSDDGKILMTHYKNGWTVSLIDANKNYEVTDILKQYAWNSLSPDGKKLVSSNLYSIHIMNTDGTDSRTVYATKNDSVQVTNPRLSRDGKHVVFEYSYQVPK